MPCCIQPVSIISTCRLLIAGNALSSTSRNNTTQQVPALKTGSVMDILGGKGTTSSSPFTAGSVMDVLGAKSNSAGADSSTTKPSGSSGQQAAPLSSLFKPRGQTWSCPTCMVDNQQTYDKCPCCDTRRPQATPTSASSAAGSSAPTQTMTSSGSSTKPPPLSALFKAKSGWSCPTCMVQNQDTHAKCPCCDTVKPLAAGAATSSSSSSSKLATSLAFSSQPPLSSLFKAKAGWSCPTCMVQNDDTMSKCPCCETSRPSGAADAASSAAGGSVFGQKVGVSLSLCSAEFAS